MIPGPLPSADRARLVWVTRSAWWMVPIVLLLGVTIPKIGQGDWMRGDSAWYAAIAVQSWRTGSLWTLFEGPGRPYFNKPPLVFWIQGLWMSIAGVGAWQARAATIAAAVIAVTATSMIARHLAGRRVAMLSGSLLAVGIEFFRRTREISLDMWALAFMLLAALAMIRIAGTWRRDRPWLMVAGAAVGAALLVKPLVALAVPILMAAFLAWDSRRGVTRAIGPWRSAAIAASVAAIAVIIAAPWYVSMIRIHGEAFVAQHFGREIADRAAGQPVGGQSQAQPVWFYAINAASSWTFWIAAGSVALAVALEKGAGRWLDPARSSLRRFGLVWAAGWFILLTAFPDRRDRYALPIHAGLALAAGSVVGGRSRSVARAMRWAPGVAAAGACALALLPVRLQRPVNEQWPALFRWLDEGAIDRAWDGSFSGAPAARLYLQTGSWPITTRDPTGRLIAQPPVGAIVLYHRRGGWEPGFGETVVWRAGDLSAARVEALPWSPVPLADAGE